MSHQDWLPRCVICKQAIDLTQRKTDEYGQAIHENCYVAMLISGYKSVVPHGFELAISGLIAGATTR